MFTCELSKKLAPPLYLQLYEGLKQEILSGKLLAGEKLPSKRELARHLAVSISTVQNAYEQLLAEGYLSSRERSGYYVLPVQALPGSHGVSFLQDPPSPPPALSASDFPFATWAKIMRRVLMEQGESLLAPLPIGGAYQLRAAISRYLYQFKAMKVSPEQIVVGAGTEYLYGLLVQLLGRERIYCLENPGYQKIGKIYTALGVHYLPTNIDSQGMMPDDLAKTSASILHLSPAHHFPTGVVMPITRRQDLLAEAYKRQGYIIEDDYDSELRYRGRPIPPIFSIDSWGRVIYMNTFAKTLSPSIRISYMVLPPALMEQFRTRLGFYSCTVPAFEQHTLARFIEEGYFERYINRTRKALRAKRTAAIHFFSSKERVRIFEEEAGMHFLIRTEEKIGPLISEAKELGIRVTDLKDYMFAPAAGYENFYVVNYEFMDLSPEKHPATS